MQLISEAHPILGFNAVVWFGIIRNRRDTIGALGRVFLPNKTEIHSMAYATHKPAVPPTPPFSISLLPSSRVMSSVLV